MSKLDRIRLPKASEIKQSRRPLTKKEKILVKFIVDHRLSILLHRATMSFWRMVCMKKLILLHKSYKMVRKWF